MNVCKQTFHISHVRISQKIKGVLKSSTYYFHMKTKISGDFQIYISVPLMFPQLFLYIVCRVFFFVEAKKGS